MAVRTILLGRWVAPVPVAAGLALALAGCATPPPAAPLAVERTTEMPNAIEVTMSKRSLAVHFEPEDTAPRPKDVEALNVLLASGDIAPGDIVKIERAPGVLADVRARALSVALQRQGLKTTMATPGGAPDGELVLNVEHATTSVPGCPNWTKPRGNDFANTVHSDFGCASAYDLAAMVADPRDLVEGKPLAPLVGDAAIWPINRYRTGVPSNPPATASQTFSGATTLMATAPPSPQASAGGDRPPGGGSSGGAPGGAAGAAATSAAGMAAGGLVGVSQ